VLLALLACSPAPPPTAAVPDPVPTARAAARARRRHARTLTVDCNGGGRYADILDALDAAQSGDTISVEPCTYYGSLHFKGKAVTIQSTGGAAVTTILGSPGKAVIEVDDGEAPGTEVSGFTIKGGGGALIPAIDDEISSLTLRDDIITGNSGTYTIYGHGAHMVLERVTIEDNVASEGLVIRGRRGEIVLKDSTLRCGTNSVGYITEHGAAFTDGSTFDCPGATGVEVFHSQGRVQRATIDGLLYVENEQTGVEGTIVEDAILLGGASVYDSDLTLRNSVVVGGVSASYANLVVEGSVVTQGSCGIQASASNVTTRWSDFWNNTTDGCGITSPVGVNGSFDADPKFVNAAGRDFRLATGSPCVDAGPTDAGYADPDGSRNDVGAYGGPLSLGGGW
jgi:hypothetical protein